MNWWLTQAFVDRNAQVVAQPADANHAPKSGAMAAFLKYNRNLYASLREKYRQKKLLKQSFSQLENLDDHYLADIGLTREDLSVMSRGETPERYSDSIDKRHYKARLSLVSAGHSNQPATPERDDCAEQLAA